ncbi:MAG TPA: zinc ribbon domain-containing protein [Thermoanaerobaculia bacterium]|nr:zinc ribbon domain-containing protein [Thermoanaerobaculia bacterium]
MVTETASICPECKSPRTDFSRVCPACGAPPLSEDDQRGHIEEVRDEDLEPYVTLRYIAKLFKVLAVLMLVMLVGEVITGIVTEGQAALITLLGEATRLLVLAGLMWGGGDITILLIDAGHDLRVARILLGRINAILHRDSGQKDRHAA